MKEINLKALGILLSSSVILALSGCDSSREYAERAETCITDLNSMTVLGYPYQPQGAIDAGLNGAGLSSLAFSLDGSVAYTITTGLYEANQFVSINIADGVGTIVGESGSDDYIEDLATQPGTGKIFAAYRRALLEVNTIDGTNTELGRIANNSTSGLAFASDGTLYYIDGDSDDEDLYLYILDPMDGITLSTTAVTNGRYMGLGYNTDDGKLYAASRENPGEIYTIEPTDGTATLVGSVDCPNGTCFLHDIAFHPITGEMYGVIGEVGFRFWKDPDDLIGAFVKWDCQP